MKYLYYQKNPFGLWSIHGSDDFPTEKAPEGTRRKIKQIVTLSPFEQKQSLNQLAKSYPLQT